MIFRAGALITFILLVLDIIDFLVLTWWQILAPLLLGTVIGGLVWVLVIIGAAWVASKN